MPSTSEKQAKLMAAVAHNPAFAKKVGIPQSVGKEFNKADKDRKSGRGGDMGKKDMSFDEKVEADNKVKEKDAEERARKYRTDAMMEKGMKKGGKVPKGMHRMPDGKMMKDSEHKKPKKPTKPKKMMGGGTMKYAHGGSVDGCAIRGKTRGRMV